MRPITAIPSTTTEEPAVDGRSTRWDDHREARRAELARAARKLVHHRGPDVSMDDIAAAAGTSKSIVYRYFTDKTGVQLAVATEVVADIRAALADAARTADGPRAALRAMVGTYLAMIESSPAVYTFVTRDGSSEHVVDSITDLLTGSGALSRLWAAGAVGFVRGTAELWLRTDPREDRDQLADQITRWLWTGPHPQLGRESHPQHAPMTPHHSGEHA
ncbi:TetR/AcrR family transcriptional regulator [Cellulomonas fimi]|uniref:TetR family transcriptional regulator n=1 Tax=Cellulomonas sp. RIT-PI-Y TaxID=3035297 RepID=UPI0021DA863C